MGSSWKSVVSFFSAMSSCCKRPPPPHSPDGVPTAPQEDPPNLPTTTPLQPLKFPAPDQLNRLIAYIEGLPTKLFHQSAASTSNAGEEFSDHVKFAAITMAKISSEAKKFEEARRILTDCLRGLDNLHWIAVAFSIVAFLLQNMHKISSNQEECIQLLEKIVDIAKILRRLTDRKLKEAVHTIMEGAIICCYYMQGETLFRFLTAQTAGQSMKNTRAKLEMFTSELDLIIPGEPARFLEQSQNILQIKDPVGMSEPFEKVKGLLEMENRQVVKAVIIYGFGGSGKTTLAEYVVSNLPLNDFRLCVIRIDERNFDIEKLQKQILFRIGGQYTDVRDSVEGKCMLRDALKDHLCFFLIDNITDKNQFKDLLPQDLSLAAGSRMLITSRKCDVKEVLPRNIQWEEFPVEVLPKEKAVELLHRIVFSNWQNATSPDDKRKMEDIAEACGGVPLLLKVYGEYLSGDWSESAYREALDSLKEGGERGLFKEEDLDNKLLYVYHQMRNQDAKDAFIEICTFFHGWQRRKVSGIVGEYELKSLQDGALLRTTESDEVMVPNVLRLMGIKEGKDTRLQSAEDLHALLDHGEDEEKLQALRKVKGIWLQNRPPGEIFHLGSEQLNKMSTALRVLSWGDGIVLNGQCEGRKFKNLVCFIVVEASKDASQLHKLAHFPFKDASKLERLAHVTLSGCRMLNSLPADFGGLRSLKCLEIHGCSNLTELPPGFGQLISLADLELRNCACLSRLPVDFGGLRSLKFLEIHGCSNLTELPQGFGQLASLRDLVLSKCSKLQSVSGDFECLTSLRRLDVIKCPVLEAATMEKVVKLNHLEELDIWGSENLESKWEEMQKNKNKYPFKVKGSSGRTMETPLD